MRDYGTHGLHDNSHRIICVYRTYNEYKIIRGRENDVWNEIIYIKLPPHLFAYKCSEFTLEYHKFYDIHSTRSMQNITHTIDRRYTICLPTKILDFPTRLQILPYIYGER